MKRYRINKTAVLTVCFYIGAFLVLIGSLSLIGRTYNPELPAIKYDYIDRTGFEKYIPVTGEPSKFIKPFTDEKVTVLKGFYDFKSSEQDQVNSLLFFEGTYLQNTAIAFGGVESFDVVAVYDGTVISVRQDELLGHVIEIEHGNNVISVYQSVSDVKVKENDIVRQGDIIAKSGRSNLNAGLNSHLLFELIVNGRIVNPDDYFDKTLKEI